MNAPLRASRRALSLVLILIGWAGAALGDLVDKAKAAPPLWGPPVKLHEPQAELVNAIALLLAVSLSMLLYGYLFDGPFSKPSARESKTEAADL